MKNKNKYTIEEIQEALELLEKQRSNKDTFVDEVKTNPIISYDPDPDDDTSFEDEVEALTNHAKQTDKSGETNSVEILKNLLETFRVRYKQEGNRFAIRLRNKKILVVDGENGNHSFSSDKKKVFKQTRLNRSGWLDFLALKRVIPFEEAHSESVRECIEQADWVADQVISFLKKEKIKYLHDPVSNFILIDRKLKRFKGMKIYINCCKDEISVNGQIHRLDINSVGESILEAVGEDQHIDF